MWLLLLAFFVPSVAFAHDAPLDTYGCHSDKLLFGTTAKRECHADLLTGKVFSSTTAEYVAYIAAQKALLAGNTATIATQAAAFTTQAAQIADLTTKLSACQANCPVAQPTVSSIVANPASVAFGATPPKTVQLTAVVTGSPGVNTAVTWKLNECVALGATLTSSGLFSAPTNLSTVIGGACQVIATSVADPTKQSITKVTITAPVTSGVTVSWKANTDPDLAGYKVYRGTASRVYQSTPLLVPVMSVPSAVVPNLAPGTTYYFAVTAYDKAGNESTFSAEVTKALP